MPDLIIKAMQLSDARDIEDVLALGEADAPVLRDLRDVLHRHGALGRFGITLLHSHFPVAEDERLVEFVDAERRTLTVRPVPTTAIAGTTVTAWSFSPDDDGETPTIECPRLCAWKPGSSEHSGQIKQIREASAPDTQEARDTQSAECLGRR